MFHLMMVLPSGVLLLLLSLIVIGSLASTNAKAKDVFNEPYKGTCVLFVRMEGSDHLRMSSDNTCNFPVAGGVVLLLLAVVFSAVHAFKALLGVSIFSKSNIIELVVSVGGAIWAIIVSVVITAGLDTTCDAVASISSSDDIPCCALSIQKWNHPANGRIYFYEGLNTAKITAWMAMFLLFCLSVAYTVLMCCGICRGRRQTAGAAETDNDDVEVLTDPVKDIDSV